nr:hypothetical protein MACL_00001349 [Theileria orientalis]
MNLPGKLILALVFLFTCNGRYIARFAGAAPGSAGYASSSAPQIGQTHRVRNDNPYYPNLNNSNNYESNYIPVNPGEPPPAAPPVPAPSSRYDQSFGMTPRVAGPPQAQPQPARQVSAVPVSQTPGASPLAAPAAAPRPLPHYADFVASAKTQAPAQQLIQAPQPVNTHATAQGKLIIFDINDRNSTTYITYEFDDETQEDVFIPNAPHSIFKVTNGDTVVWTSTNHTYPDEVRVRIDDRGEPKVRIFFPPVDQPQAKTEPAASRGAVPEETGQLPKLPEPEVYSAYFTTVEVDSKKSTNKIKYEFDQVKNLERFTAKQPFMIERVTKSGKTIWPHGKLINPALKLIIRKTRSGKDRLKVFFFEDEDEDDEEEEEDPEFGFQPRVVPAGTQYGYTAPAAKAPQQQLQPQLPQLPQLKPIQPPQVQHVQPAQTAPHLQPAHVQPPLQLQHQAQPTQVQPVVPPIVQPPAPQQPVPERFGDHEPFESESAYELDFDQIIAAPPQPVSQLPYPYGTVATAAASTTSASPTTTPATQQFQSPYPYGYLGQQGQFPGYPAFSAYPGLPQVPGYPAFPGQPQYPGITGYPVQPGQMPAQPGQMYPGALGPTQPVSEAEDPWADILLLTKDQNNKSVLLHQDLYDPKAIANNVVQYALAQHARCTSIRSGKKTIWKHYPQEYGDSFPQTITHNKNTHKISIHFKEFIILYQRDTDGKWNDTEYDLRLFTVNPRDRRSIIEMDSTQYHLGKVDDEKYQFTFRDGVRCAEVHIDEQIVWKHGEFSMQDPLMVSYHEQLDEIAVGNEQKLLVYYKLDDGWPFYRTKYINGHRRPITGNTNRDRGLPYTSSPGTSEEEIPQAYFGNTLYHRAFAGGVHYGFNIKGYRFNPWFSGPSPLNHYHMFVPLLLTVNPLLDTTVNIAELSFLYT